MKYSIIVSEAELQVVSLALGRMLDAKPIVERKPAAVKRGPVSKPPRLSAGQFDKVTNRWAEAVEYPHRWRAQLAGNAGKNTGRTADDVARAWGVTL